MGLALGMSLVWAGGGETNLPASWTMVGHVGPRNISFTEAVVWSGYITSTSRRCACHVITCFEGK